MRWLNRRRREERGAVAVWVAVSAIPLLAVAALGADVGMLYWEKGQLQNGADAAALAIAQNCGTDPANCTAEANGVAATFAGGNANDASAASTLTEFAVNGNSGTVRVNTSTIDDGDTTIRHPFASAFLPGIWETTVRASAKAEWGVPISGTTIPLAIAECELADRLAGYDFNNPTRILIRNDTNAPCPGGGPGGFGWLADADCSVQVQDNAVVLGTTGNNEVGTGCPAGFAEGLLGKTVLVPLYDQTQGTGSNLTYTISRFAAFTITGVKTRGGTEIYLNGQALPPTFTGPARGIQGYFVRYVELGEAFELGNGPNYGLMIARLID